MENREKKAINEIAYENGLELVEFTRGRNGYPERLHNAVIGFEDFAEAEAMADNYGLELAILGKRDGWQLWERYCGACGPLFLTDFFTEDHNFFFKCDAENYYNEYVKPYLCDFENIDELSEFVKNQAAIIEELACIGNYDMVVTYCGKYYDTLPGEAMQYHDRLNGCTYAIGLVEA